MQQLGICFGNICYAATADSFIVFILGKLGHVETEAGWWRKERFLVTRERRKLFFVYHGS